MRRLIITGLPGSGKSTLARQLARRLGVPLIGKDAIKERLFETLPARDAAASRRLSDASFAVMFEMARELAEAGLDCILEGNFRGGEHEAALLALPPARTAQILCRIGEELRGIHLAARAHDASRHEAHRGTDSNPLARPDTDRFLDLPGPRLLCCGDDLAAQHDRTLKDTSEWWRAPPDPPDRHLGEPEHRRLALDPRWSASRRHWRERHLRPLRTAGPAVRGSRPGCV